MKKLLLLLFLSITISSFTNDLIVTTHDGKIFKRKMPCTKEGYERLIIQLTNMVNAANVTIKDTKAELATYTITTEETHITLEESNTTIENNTEEALSKLDKLNFIRRTLGLSLAGHIINNTIYGASLNLSINIGRVHTLVGGGFIIDSKAVIEPPVGYIINFGIGWWIF